MVRGQALAPLQPGLSGGQTLTEFRILGPLEVWRGGSSVQPTSAKQRHLLALLLIHANTVVSTDALLEALWGDRAPPSAPAVLQTYVSQLRRLLEPGSTAGGGSRRLTRVAGGYRLSLAPDELDAERFRRLLKDGRRALRSSRFEAASRLLAEALGMWRGRALAEFGDETALHAEGERLEELRIECWEERIQADLALGRHSELVPELTSLTAAHPLRERLHGQLMLALYLAGRQADALRVCRELRNLLREELGINPTPEIASLEVDILKQSPALAWTAPAVRTKPGVELPVRTHSTDQLPFVGRGAEITELANWLRARENGVMPGSPLALVVGPAGVGKTRLVTTFAQTADWDDAAVLYGRAMEDGGVPYEPLLGPLRQLVADAADQELASIPGPAAAELARLVPEVGERRQGPPLRTGGVDRLVRFDAIVGCVARLAEGRRVLLVLEDLHWADRPTLLLLSRLLHADSAVAVLATYREPEVNSAEALADFLSELRREDRPVLRVRLAPLSLADVETLLATLSGGDLSLAGRAFATHLHKRTGGNAFFIRETLRHLSDIGAIAPSNSLWAAERPLAELGIPEGVREVLSRRLARLSGGCRAALRAASVIGQDFTVGILAAAMEDEEAALLAGLEEALAAGLLEEDPSGPDRYAFVHALVRGMLEEELSRSRRARVHWRIGEALQHVAGGTADTRAAEIAYHLGEGAGVGDPLRGVDWALRAADRALEQLAFEDAVAHYAQAQEICVRFHLDDDERLWQACYGSAEAASALVDHAGTREALLAGAAIARRRGWSARLARVACRHAYFFTVGEIDAELAAVTTEALNGVGPADSVERVLLLSAKVCQRTFAYERGDARGQAEDIVVMARRLGDPEALCYALTAKCHALYGGPAIAELDAAVEEAVDLATLLKDREGVPHLSLGAWGVVPAQRADRAAFDRAIERSRALGKQLHSIFMATYAHVLAAAAALCEGRFSEALTIAARAMEDNDSVQRGKHGTYGGQLVAAWVERAEYDELVAGLERVVARLPNLGHARAILATAYLDLGQRSDALRLLSRLQEDGLDRIWHEWSAPIAIRHLAEAAARLNDAGLAGAVAEAVAPYSGQMLVPYVATSIEAAADRILGQALLVLGQTDQAVRALEGALALEDGFRASALSARTAFWLSVALSTRGSHRDNVRARGLMEAAEHAARSFGMRGLLAQAHGRADS
jgi:DNA-binding SARP family transcriptional activator